MTEPARRAPNPAVLILGASIVSGATGYLITAILPARLGVVDYAAFAVFWSALFILTGSFGGVQQEYTRATSERVPGVPRTGARPAVFALVVAAGLFALLAATTPLWSPIVLPGAAPLAWPLALGAACYVLVAALSGSLYGIRLWYPLVALIAVDGLLRLAGVLLVLLLGGGLPELGWAVAAPFPLAIAIVLPFIARRMATGLHLDVGYRALSWNVARTVLAAAATATLISGFPLLLRITSPDAPGAEIGPLILALTLTRAPIVIPLLSLQSYLVVHFGDGAESLARRALTLIGLVVAGALVLAGLAAWIGPGILLALFGSGFVVGPGVLFALVASSGLVAALCVSGPAVLARSQHGVYVGGWLVASLVTIGLLLVPLPLEGKTLLALLGGPLVGLAVHLVALARRRLPLARD